MNPTTPSPREIVSHVLQAWRAGASDERVVEQLVAMGVHDAEADDALELVRSGIGRAALLSVGLPPSQISSDVDDDPIFRAAVEAGRLEIPQAAREEPRDIASVSADLTSEDVEARRTAASELGQSRDPAATAQLLAALDDTDMYVRTYAIQSLATRKAKEAVAPCSALLGSDAPRLILVNAIKALAEIGDAAAVPALIEATHHENPFVRHDAAWALGEFRDPRAIPALEALLEDTTVPVERDEDGLPSQTSIYSVSDHAKRSLDKIRGGGLAAAHYSVGYEFALSLLWITAGGAILALTLYDYSRHGGFSKVALVCGSLVLIVGLAGILLRRARAVPTAAEPEPPEE